MGILILMEVKRTKGVRTLKRKIRRKVMMTMMMRMKPARKRRKEEIPMMKETKRKAMVAGLLDPNASNESNAKKSRLEQFGGSSAGSSGSIAGTEAITDEAVRRYLKRRPMTTTDLLKKFRSKKTGIMNAQLVQLLANILKKINPHKQKVKGVTYLSLKEGQ